MFPLLQFSFFRPSTRLSGITSSAGVLLLRTIPFIEPFGSLFSKPFRSAAKTRIMLAMGRRKKFSRENVLDKAISVFWKHGFAQTTVQDLERATGVNKSGLYTDFKGKEDLFIASMRRYFDALHALGTLTKKPLGWDNIEHFVKLCDGAWGIWDQKGCYSVNSMRELPNLPLEARGLMIASLVRIRKGLMRNLSAARPKRNNEAVADLIITFFVGISLEQNFNPTKKQIADKVSRFMRLIREL
jgi:AcrR family transcriptional regulator